MWTFTFESSKHLSAYSLCHRSTTVSALFSCFSHRASHSFLPVSRAWILMARLSGKVVSIWALIEASFWLYMSHFSSILSSSSNLSSSRWWLGLYIGIGGGTQAVPSRCLCIPLFNIKLDRVCCFQVIQLNPLAASLGIEWAFIFVKELVESLGPIICCYMWWNRQLLRSGSSFKTIKWV